MTDETEEKPAADPLAKARAAKAAKALAKAEAELQAAEQGAAPAETKQPTVSSLRTKALNPYMGEQVTVRVTSWGHGQISTGGEHGFERYAKGAEITMAEQNARSLFNKRWIEPLDPRLVDRWVEQNAKEIRAAMAAKGATERFMRDGVRPGEEWRTALTGGDMSFSVREEDLVAYGLAG